MRSSSSRHGHTVALRTEIRPWMMEQQERKEAGWVSHTFTELPRQLCTELPNSEFPTFERINFGVFKTLFLGLLLTLNPVPQQDFTAPTLFDLGWGFPQL